ncbi:DNA cytosine methyltransferase [Paenibacillus larvae]|uniref:DNA cytosine methyltransferase n=1 Tax=Paenibacillus larvae TaxID=1464 RepID=UPI002280840B|nr:DNA cytosine methyltransferase [Paenibacillus larvae]MCY9509147.1 DNA cytosine methyltransferase [Paenibacillus larvae]MCY9524959.1 DNA cytosine methyltransferase [Paenibacillus larvae]
MRVVDLFAGCGGMSRGFGNAGHEIVAAYENWDDAIACYRENFSHQIFKQDLSNYIESAKLISNLSFDMIIGGPPCQDFSHAGKRTEGDRADLTLAFAEIINTVSPRWFVMENVDRSKNSRAYAKARDIFKKAGYGLTEKVLDASLCGVPQKRKRFFCIGLVGAKDGFLEHMIKIRLSERPMTLRQYFGEQLNIEYYYRHPRNYNRRAVFSIDEPAPTIRGVNRPVPKGYVGHHNDVAPVTPELRELTTFERAKIQTFPNDFIWIGSKTTLEQMIGNAVPVKLAEFVGEIVRDYEELILQQGFGLVAKDSLMDEQNFIEWLKRKFGYIEKSAKDVRSRVKRANRFFNIYADMPEEEVLFKLSQNPNFKGLSTSVKSQLKRGVKLYREYLREKAGHNTNEGS